MEHSIETIHVPEHDDHGAAIAGHPERNMIYIYINPRYMVFILSTKYIIYTIYIYIYSIKCIYLGADSYRVRGPSSPPKTLSTRKSSTLHMMNVVEPHSSVEAFRNYYLEAAGSHFTPVKEGFIDHREPESHLLLLEDRRLHLAGGYGR